MVQVVPDTAECRFFWNGGSGTPLEGCEAEMTLYVRDTLVPWIQSKLDDLATFCRDWWQSGKNAGAPFRSHVSTAWGLDHILVRDIGSLTGLQSSLPGNTAGSLAGDPVAPNCAMLIKFRCDPGGFPRQGWVFAPVGSENNLSGNFWSNAFVTSVAQAFIDFNTDLNDPLAGGAAGQAQVRVSRSSGTAAVIKSRAVARPQGLTNTLAAITGKEEVASQRDRRASV